MLSRKQQQFLNLVSGGYKFDITRGNNGFCAQSITDYNCTLYATLTMRSLIRRGLIHVTLGGISLTDNGAKHQQSVRRSTTV